MLKHERQDYIKLEEEEEMKNKLISLLLIFILVMSVLVGCKAEDTNVTENNLIEGEELEEGKDNEEVIDNHIGETDEYGILEDEETVTFIDARDVEVSVSKNTERPVILFGSFANIWVRNGGKLAGMVEVSVEDLTPGMENVETVGKQGAISLEKVISLDPDLVILSSNTQSQMDLIPSLEENNIPLVALDYQFKEDYFKISKIFAKINGRIDLYEEDTRIVKEETEKIMEKAPKSDNPKVLIIMASKSSIGARPSDTTIGEMFKDLNAINIADNSNGALDLKNFSLEKIIEEDPDFIFVQTMGSDLEAIEERLQEDVKSNPAWASLTAVKNDRYIALDKDLYTYKANDRYAEAYEKLAEILYPEVFK